jgi:hypothetical protein
MSNISQDKYLMSQIIYLMVGVSHSTTKRKINTQTTLQGTCALRELVTLTPAHRLDTHS